MHGVKIDSAAGPEPVDVSWRGCLGIAGDEARDRDLVRLTRKAVLDSSSVGVSDRLDQSLCPDGHQLLEALGSDTVVSGSHKSDDLVPGATGAQRAVVTGILRLARHPVGSDYNSCAASRGRHDDGHGLT